MYSPDCRCIVPSSELKKCPIYSLMLITGPLGISKFENHRITCNICSLHGTSAMLIKWLMYPDAPLMAEILLADGKVITVNGYWLFPIPKKCSCDTDVLVAHGCQCGGI